MITKIGLASWEGDLKTGKGTVSTQSNALQKHPYGFNTRFEGDNGTNPEELIGAAHASCFSMALSKILGEADIVPDMISSESIVHLEKDGDSFSITKIELQSIITAFGADEAVVKECAETAKDGCPISKLLDAKITLETTIKT